MVMQKIQLNAHVTTKHFKALQKLLDRFDTILRTFILKQFFDVVL